MAPAWDQHTEESVASLQNALVREQVSASIATFSPLWRQRFTALGVDPSSLRSPADLEALPALGEREVSPDGDPMRMSALVLQAAEAGQAFNAVGPGPGRSSRRRARGRDRHRAAPGSDSRSTSYVFSGFGFRFPVASTRDDLDVIAHAGARLWRVLGLTRDDLLISAVPPAATTEHVALQGAALAAGTPAIFPGEGSAGVAAAARLAPPTVLAVLSATAPQVLSGLTDLTSVRTLLLVGAPSQPERLAAAHALSAVGGRPDVVILGVHAPSGARVLWGECRESGGTTGLHTYPDLDLAQVVDPDTAGRATGRGELVLTQLGMRGSALFRWRTGDVIEAITTRACPSCHRVVPRIEGLQRAALIARLDTGRVIDLRSIATALLGRPDIDDWRIVVGRRRRDGAMTVVVHFIPADADNPDTVIGVATDMRALAGRVPTQLVEADRSALVALRGQPLSSRILIG